LKDLNTATPPSLRPNDFPDELSYEEWKHEESKAISELTVSMIEANPLLAISEPTEVLSSLLSDSQDRPELRRAISETEPRYSIDIEPLNVATNGKFSRPDMPRRVSMNDGQEEFAPKNIYTFIPEDPRAYYRRLVELCLKAQQSEYMREQSDRPLLSSETRALLYECSVRWRVHPAARISLLLDAVKQLYDSDELGIEDANEAFSIADNWNYSSWPVADVQTPLCSLIW
jgi:hypothetical protein